MTSGLRGEADSNSNVAILPNLTRSRHFTPDSLMHTHHLDRGPCRPLSCPLIEKPSRGYEVCSFEALGEPDIDRIYQIACIVTATLSVTRLPEAHGSA
jgi:hypothetical protein